MVKSIFLVTALASLVAASPANYGYGEESSSSSNVKSTSSAKPSVTSSINYGQDPTTTSSVKSIVSSSSINYGQDPATSSSSKVKSTSSKVPDCTTHQSSTVQSTRSSATPTPTPPTYGDDPVNPPVNATCAKNVTYAAVLFEQTQFDGTMHWIDGTNGECRGLSGVNVGSVHFVSEAGGSIITKKVSDAYAKGVTLTFYDEYACGGNKIQSVKGNTQKVTGVAAKSVRIECNGEGQGSGAAIPQSPSVAIRLFAKDSTVGDFSSQTDGSIDECRGLSGSPIHAAEFLATANSTTAMSNDASMAYSVVFYEEFACAGKRLGSIVGNKASFRPIAAKSLKFVKPAVAVAVAAEDSVGQLTSAAAVVNTFAGVLAALVAGSFVLVI